MLYYILKVLRDVILGIKSIFRFQYIVFIFLCSFYNVVFAITATANDTLCKAKDKDMSGYRARKKSAKLNYQDTLFGHPDGCYTYTKKEGIFCFSDQKMIPCDSWCVEGDHPGYKLSKIYRVPDPATKEEGSVDNIVFCNFLDSTHNTENKDQDNTTDKMKSNFDEEIQKIITTQPQEQQNPKMIQFCNNENALFTEFKAKKTSVLYCKSIMRHYGCKYPVANTSSSISSTEGEGAIELKSCDKWCEDKGKESLPYLHKLESECKTQYTENIKMNVPINAFIDTYNAVSQLKKIIKVKKEQIKENNATLLKDIPNSIKTKINDEFVSLSGVKLDRKNIGIQDVIRKKTLKDNVIIMPICTHINKVDSEEGGCFHDLKKILKKTQGVCKKGYEKAKKCCEDPIKCAGDGKVVPEFVKGLSLIKKNLPKLRKAVGDSKVLCNSILGVSGTLGAGVMSAIHQCKKAANTCEDSCSEELEKLRDKVKKVCGLTLFARAKKKDSDKEEDAQQEDETEQDTPNYLTCSPKIRKWLKREVLELEVDEITYKEGNKKRSKKIVLYKIPKNCAINDKQSKKLVKESLRSFTDGVSQVTRSSCGKSFNPIADELFIPSHTVTNPHVVVGSTLGHAPGGGSEITDNDKINTGNKGTLSDIDPIFGEPPIDDKSQDKKEDTQSADSGDDLLGSIGSGGLQGGDFSPGKDSPSNGPGNKNTNGGKTVLLDGWRDKDGYSGSESPGERAGDDPWSDSPGGSTAVAKNQKLSFTLPKIDVTNKMNRPFGSSHDDIFQRVNSRIKSMCRKKQINCL